MLEFFKKLFGRADINKDGKVDVVDIVQTAEKVATKAKAAVKKTADVNKDGKVDKADAKVAVEKVKTVAKKVTAKKTSK